MTVFLRNVWYMAGWSNELAEKPPGRRLFDRGLRFDGAGTCRRNTCSEHIPKTAKVDAGGLRVGRRLKAMLARENPA